MAILNSSGQEVVSYTYDEEGKLTAVNDGISGKTTTYYYDALDRLTLKEIRASGVLSLAVRYQYDEEDQLIGKTVFSDGQAPVHTAYAYDHLHNLSQITGEDVFPKISYSSHGLLEQTTTGYTSGGADHTVKQENYVYGTDDTSLHQHTVTYGGKTNTDTYTYDGRGNTTQITRKVGSTEYIIKYTYDAANQLIREDNQQAGYSWVMTYDDAGNMLTRKKYSYTTSTLGSVLSTQTLTYGNATWGDLLTGINGTTVTSDAIGNVLNDGTWTYTWKNGRQLATMSKSGVTWSFAYDANGMRTQRVSGSTTYTYTYDDSTLLKMTVGSNTLIFTYGINGQPMSVNYNGTEYYYITNAQGDVVGILNSSGTEVVTYTYDAWGNILSTGGTMANTLGAHNPLRYRGYVYDQETGLYYVSSRYYDPEIGRFINADDADYLGADGSALSYNLFAYCINNPVNRFDVNGNWSLPNWAKVAIGAVAIAVGVIATAATGGAAAPVLVASLKIAATSAAVGAVSGAGISAVSHRVSTGSWEGAGKAAVTGAIDGACDGFMWGGITAGASFTTAAAKGIRIQEIGKLNPSNKSGDGYTGVKYQVPKANGKYTTRSIELHSPHSSGPHNFWHWQQNTWNPYNNSITGSAKHWTIWGKKL